MQEKVFLHFFGQNIDKNGWKCYNTIEVDDMENDFVITKINRVIMVGKDEYPESKTSFFHDLKHNELIFHFSGQAMVYFNDECLDTRPNTVRFLPKGAVHRYDVIRQEYGECIDVFFDADREIAPMAFVMGVAQNEKIGVLFKRLFATWVSKKDGFYFESIALLYRIFAELQKVNTSPKRYEQKLAPALDKIHHSFLSTDFSIPELAAHCDMRESYFQKLFKARYGVPPKKYIIRLKINHSCDLLRLERYTVTQIAELSGFSDVYFFSRQFKEYMGITPTQFIKKYRSSK